MVVSLILLLAHIKLNDLRPAIRLHILPRTEHVLKLILGIRKLVRADMLAQVLKVLGALILPVLVGIVALLGTANWIADQVGLVDAKDVALIEAGLLTQIALWGLVCCDALSLEVETGDHVVEVVVDLTAKLWLLLELDTTFALVGSRVNFVVDALRSRRWGLHAWALQRICGLRSLIPNQLLGTSIIVVEIPAHAIHSQFCEF